MDNSIELFKGEKAWMARNHGYQAKMMIALFGTDTLPTAFTPEADAQTVLEAISALNPGTRVYLRQEVSRG